MTRIAPYLNFRGEARAAMEFYQTVFGGDLVLNSADDLGLAVEGERRAHVMHAELTTSSGMVLTGSDIHAEDEDAPEIGNVSTIMVSGAENELQRIWGLLSAQGSVTVPFGRAPWGDLFASCIDRFGIPWLINVN